MPSLLDLFRRRRPTAPPVHRTPIRHDDADGAAGNLDQAVPTLAAVLRHLGEGAFDMDETSAVAINERLERWADHVASGVAPPDRGAAVPAARRNGRDWNGVRSAVRELRRAEKTFVQRSGKELRDTLWTFIQRLSSGFVEDQGSDARIDTQLQRLKGAVQTSNLSELRREVLGAVDGIRQLVVERAERNRRELQLTLAELDDARQQLSRARRELALDPLTQLYNRGCLDEQLATVRAMQVLAGAPCTLLLVDIDDFKKVNDQLGHPAGDAVLRALADTMVRTLPRKTDFIARYGGEEFAIIFQRDGAPVARMLARRLLDAVHALRIPWESKELQITVSIGLAELEKGESLEDWVKRTDRALYEAKRAGKDRIAESQ